MTTFIPRELGVLALFAIATTGCQPGGETSGIDGTGVSGPVAAAAYGRMTGSSDFIVNGVHYDTTSMAVTIDGVPGRISDVAMGDIVLVTATLDSTDASTGVAQKAVLEHAVVGPVDSVDSAGGFIVALGQTVKLANAMFDLSIPQSSIAGLAVGDIVEVSGFRDQRSEVIASRIAKRAPGSPGLRAAGRIANLDDTAKRFRINALTVDYAAAAVTPGPSGSLEAGSVVEVSGAIVGSAGELVAERVVFKPTDVTASPGAYVNLEGYVTALDAADPLSFEVAGLPITTTSATEKDPIAFDTRTEVKGALGTTGTLVASKVHTGIVVPPGKNLLQGLVYDAYKGPVANAGINISVQTSNAGYNWWFVTGRGYFTNEVGRYEVRDLPDAQIQLWGAPFRQGYVQPCAVTFDITGDTTHDIEVVHIETLNSLAPPLPITAHEPTLTGTVYEVTPTGRQPVAGAQIVADGADGLGWVLANTLTDLNGHYFLCDLPKGMVLQVWKDRYVMKEIWPIGGPPSTTLDIEIQRE